MQEREIQPINGAGDSALGREPGQETLPFFPPPLLPGAPGADPAPLPLIADPTPSSVLQAEPAEKSVLHLLGPKP